MHRNYVYLNGKFLPEKEAKISVFSGGVLYGQGLFETMRVRRGQVFRLEEHLQRLKNGAKVLGLKVPKDLGNSKEIIQQLVKLNALSDAYLRLMLLSDEKKGSNLIFICRDINSYLKKKNSWTCVIVKSVRQNEFSPLSKLKTLNYLPLLLARKEAESRGADEGILLNTKGEICEGSRTNIFIITEDGKLNTPPVECGCLPGITRGAVIELVESLGLKIKEKKLKTEDLKRAKEIFLTNSLIGVMPVAKIDNLTIGKEGPLTRRIRNLYQNLPR